MEDGENINDSHQSGKKNDYQDLVVLDDALQESDRLLSNEILSLDSLKESQALLYLGREVLFCVQRFQRQDSRSREDVHRDCPENISTSVDTSDCEGLTRGGVLMHPQSP